MQGVHDAHTPEGSTPGASSESDAAKSPEGDSRPSASRMERLRTFVRLRRYVAPLLLLALPIVVVGLDFARRGERIAAFDGEYATTYALAFLESVVLWAFLLISASRKKGVGRHVSAVLLAVFATFAIGGQIYFFEQYNAYLNTDVSVFATNFMDSVVNQLFADIGNYLRAKLPILALALALIWAGRRAIRPRRSLGRTASVLAPILVIASFFIPTQHRHVQASTPDVLYMNAVGGLLLTHAGMTEQSNQVRPRLRESLPVPPLTPASGTPKRNIVFVILESVRADATCIEHDPECRRTEKTNRYFPDRLPFTQMRSVASSTAISLAVLWGGLYPIESREILHTWPLLFDYARSAGYDTAYWTSQNMMFGNVRLWVKNLGVRKFVSATELDPTADLDMGSPEYLLAEHVNAEIGTLAEPFFAVVQLSNVHYPYFVDPTGPQPFQPATTSKAPDENGSFFNYYQNAVYQQDQHIARMLHYLRTTPAGARTVIVYTSDHGEAFREHGQMGHTFSVFDEEVHVPMWIDAPPGTLTDEELSNLRKKKDAFLFHVDVAPTVLDLMGIHDAPELARYKTRIHGHSMLRSELSEQPIPMSNCTGVWSCAFENWGAMLKNKKIEARSWDHGWKCYDVAADPYEREDLGVENCRELHAFATKMYGRLPGQGIEKPAKKDED